MAAKSFVVFGLGKFGYSVATSLCNNGCEVLAVDLDGDIVEDIANDVTFAVKANVTDPDVYKSLGIGNMDGAVVAIADNMEASILATIFFQGGRNSLCAGKAHPPHMQQCFRKWGRTRS